MEYICYHGHCSWNTFAVIVVVLGIHLLPWSLVMENIAVMVIVQGTHSLSCSLNKFAVIFIVH